MNEYGAKNRLNLGAKAEIVQAVSVYVQIPYLLSQAPAPLNNIKMPDAEKHHWGIFRIFEKCYKTCFMRTFLLIAVISLFAVCLNAQESVTRVKADSLPARERLESDTLSVPLKAPVLSAGTVPFSMYGMTPFDYAYTAWELHKGFNASVGLNVTFSPSRYAPSGAGFGQNAAFMYAVPVTDRLSVAAGIYANNFNWGFIDYRNVGFAAVAAFKVNERVSLYAYGNKSFMPKRSALYYPLPDFAPDRLGGMVNFKLGESSSISFGVEGIRYPNGYYWW